jgi:cell division protein FtsZ
MAEPAIFAVPPPEPEPIALSQINNRDAAPEAVPPPLETDPRVILPKKKVTVAKEPKPPVEKVQARQEVLQFEAITRGRFEKSEPTIVEGQDLDVPTFLRKNVRVK